VTTLPVAFLTDYGNGDEFAGSCRLVIERLGPGTKVVDLTHGIPPGDVRRGALALEAAARRAGPAVYLGVVDPGVGTERRAVALTAGHSHLVGPDNGLLALAAEVLGGVKALVDVSASPLALEPVAPTFHGRDVFAPVAAHLAAGRPLEAAGQAAAPESLRRLDLPSPRRDGRTLVAHVLYADRFGNLVLDAGPGDLEFDGDISIGVRTSEFSAVRAPTFAHGEGGLVVYESSSGRLAVAVDRGSAAELLGAGRDDELALAPAS
jgi:S-adenosylmethionine hydrolase